MCSITTHRYNNGKWLFQNAETFSEIIASLQEEGNEAVQEGVEVLYSSRRPDACPVAPDREAGVLLLRFPDRVSGCNRGPRPSTVSWVWLMEHASHRIQVRVFHSCPGSEFQSAVAGQEVSSLWFCLLQGDP